MSLDAPSLAASRLRPLLGTFVAVEATAARGVVPAIEAAFASVARVEALMHPTAAGSDVRRLNRARVGQKVHVDRWTHEVLRLSVEINRASAGAFDPCRPTLPGRVGDLELAEDHIVICRRPVVLDLGGIAKGFAVDRAIDALIAHGCDSALVNAGGDLRVFGPRAHRVFVRMGQMAFSAELENASLSVSGPHTVGAPSEHAGYYRGSDGEGLAGRWVVITAAHCAVSDALCKCAMLDYGARLDTLLAKYSARQIALPAQLPSGLLSGTWEALTLDTIQ